ERYVGHFYRRGLVWMLDHNSPREPDGQNVWLGLEPTTGAVVRELKTQGEWPRTDTPAKMGCQLLIASDQYIMIPRQATYIDFETGGKLPFKFVRGGCGLGFVPANGLVYSHPHACGCFSEAIRGFIGMHSTAYNEEHPEESAAGRLQTFSPLQWSDATTASPSDWHHYRRDPHRSGASAVVLPADLDLRWSITVASRKSTVSQSDWELRSGNPVTAPTISGSTVYVADVDGGRVIAVDRQRGAVRWSFQANGRIDSPPTIHRGLCLFGAHDGYVYGLDAASGRLGWKFRAAPVERRIVAFGQVESTWPVAGTVLVHEGIAYAAAGRAPDADGGITVHALNPLTGEAFWSSRVEGGTFRGLCDYLIAGDGVVYLGNWQFDARTGAHGPAPGRSPHLQGGKVGLLEASWTRHDLALRKEIQTWTAAGAEGQLLAFSPKTTAAYHAEKRLVEVTGPVSQVYTLPAPEQVTALVLAGQSLVLAGGKDRARPQGAGFLRVLDADSGRIAFEHTLSAEAVLDGAAVTDEVVAVATQDGQLHAFGTGVLSGSGS
ncbi:MAG: PQQ-binding-like beta-propeller repeat protein, partial [Pirellulaceae bacterium]